MEQTLPDWNLSFMQNLVLGTKHLGKKCLSYLTQGQTLVCSSSFSFSIPETVCRLRLCWIPLAAILLITILFQ